MGSLARREQASAGECVTLPLEWIVRAQAVWAATDVISNGNSAANANRIITLLAPDCPGRIRKHIQQGWLASGGSADYFSPPDDLPVVLPLSKRAVSQMAPILTHALERPIPLDAFPCWLITRKQWRIMAITKPQLSYGTLGNGKPRHSK